MPPELPPFLVILDTFFDEKVLKGKVEYVKPPETGPDSLKVRWGVGSPPVGYEPRGGGVVFVANSSDSPPAPDERVIHRVNGRYTFSEGLPRGTPWLMLVIILPRKHTLARPNPPLAGSHLFQDRLAVYWRLTKGDIPDFVETSWELADEATELGAALRDLPSGAQLPFSEKEAPEFSAFLSYRRKDDRWAARSICERLSEVLGEHAVFRDVDAIGLGEDFRNRIDDAVGRCAVMLVLIGPYWLDPGRRKGKRRIDSEDDWVRIEIEMALQRHRLVIPLLLDNAEVPKASALPPSLRELAYKNSQNIGERTFDSDLQNLTAALRKHSGFEAGE